MVALVLVAVGAGLAFFYALWRLANGPGAHLPKSCKLPPAEKGVLPWIGCAKAFGKEPLWFIGKSQEKHGDIFTIMAAGRWMTFVLDPTCFPHVFSSDAISFTAAVFPIVNKVAGVSIQEFSKYHATVNEALKGRLSSTTAVLCPAMCREFHSSLCSHGYSGEKELMDFVQETMFASITRELFGRDAMPKKKDEMLRMMEVFKQYDKEFEMGAEMPEILLRNWSKSKYKLLEKFQAAVSKGEGGVGVVADVFLPLAERKVVPNLLLLVFWAAHGNATPVAFWTLCHILSDPAIYRTAMEEVEKFKLYNKDGEFSPVEEAELKKCSFVKRCLMESARLHAPGAVVRKVVRTHTLQGYTIPAGHMIILSPYWIHKNPQYFPEPTIYKPDRWLECDLDKNQFLKGFVPFGGGRYQCSGKTFAIMEMHLLVVMVLKMFEVEMLDSFPKESPAHMLGTTHPATSCKVKFRRRLP